MTLQPAFDPHDAAWCAHRYDAKRDEVHFRHVPRAEHGRFPFLTDEYVGDRPVAYLGREEAVAAATSAAATNGGGRVRLILHSAFCGSTVLARAFDRPGLAMGLSEPVILNDIVGLRRRREAEPRTVARLLDDGLRLLARPWGTGEAVVVKPSNILNPLGAAMLALRAEARAVLLHAPLDVFLLSVARKGLWCRLWSRELLEGLLIDGVVDLGFEASDYFRLTDLQVAAVGWLAQARLFEQLHERHAAQVMRLDSETMFADPATAITRAGAHFALSMSEADVAAIADGPAFQVHSKHGTSFGAGARAAESAAARDAYGEEVDKVLTWARAVASNAGIGID